MNLTEKVSYWLLLNNKLIMITITIVIKHIHVLNGHYLKTQIKNPMAYNETLLTG